MKRLGRLLLALLGLLLLAAGLLAAFIGHLDPNQYKAQIEAAVRRETGRELSLTGPIEIFWWPQIRLRASGFTLGNAPGYSAPRMLEVAELDLSVATLPLLAGRLTMDTARIHGLVVHLARNAAGQTNWDDLRGPRGQGQTSGGLMAIALGGVDVRDATLHWLDARSGQQLTLTQLDVRTGALAFDRPIDFTLSTRLEAAQPALDGDAKLTGTVTYSPQAQRYRVPDFHATASLQGKALPGGKATLSLDSAVELDLAQGSLSLSALKAEGLGLKLAADLSLAQLHSPRPGGRARWALESKDLAVVFKALDLPASQRLAGFKNRALDFHGTAELQADHQALTVSDLVAQLPGLTLGGALTARQWGSAAPAVKAKLTAKAEDLPRLLMFANDWTGGDRRTAQALENLLAGTKARDFGLDLALDADLASGRVALSQCHAHVLDHAFEASLTPTGGAPGKPAFNGRVTAVSPNLPALVALYETLRGAVGARLDDLATLGEAPARELQLTLGIDADFAQDRLSVTGLDARLLGGTLGGQFSVIGLQAGTPVVSGDITGAGADLPGLLAQAARLAGQPPPLMPLPAGTDASFGLSTQFKAQPLAGTLHLAPWRFTGLGVTLDGELHAVNAQKADGSLEASLRAAGPAPAPLLSALGQPALAAGLRDLTAELKLTGSPSALVLGPLTANARWQGPSARTPVALTLEAGGIEIYPERDTFSAKDLALRGPGLEVTGNLEAVHLRTAPVWNGQLTLTETNLRTLLPTLGLPLPETADPKALRAVALDTVFQHGPAGLALSRLNLHIDQTQLNGEVSVAGLAPPDVGFSLRADALNLDRYLPPASTGKPQRGATVTTPELALAGAASLPVEMLRQLKLSGDLSLERLQVAGLNLAQAHLTVAGADGLIRLDPVSAEGYQGRYSGVATLDATGKLPQLSLNTSLAKIALEPLLVDLAGNRDLAGNINFEARLSATGAQPQALLESLSGQATFAVQNGELRGLDATALIRSARQALNGKPVGKLPSGGSTAFRALTGTLEVRNGAVFNQDLRLDGDGFRLSGKGMLFKLADRSMKYDARLAIDPENPGGKSFDLPLQCRGPLRPAGCQPDLKALLKTLAGDAARKKLTATLKQALEGKREKRQKP